MPDDAPGLDVDSISRLIVPVLREHGVRRASIFGSAAKGRMHSGSDIDLLVELPRGKSLLDLVALNRHLENVLGRTVDLAEFDTVHPLIRDQVLSEQVAVV
jgi:uncharacterized protein